MTGENMYFYIYKSHNSHYWYWELRREDDDFVFVKSSDCLSKMACKQEVLTLKDVTRDTEIRYSNDEDEE